MPTGAGGTYPESCFARMRKTAICARVTIEPGHEFLYSDVEPGSYVLLAMSDTGIGMEPELAARAFEPFFTTKGGNGTGLGLATVFGIVTQCGGRVRIESAAGVGTTLLVFLPQGEVSA